MRDSFDEHTVNMNDRICTAQEAKNHNIGVEEKLRKNKLTEPEVQKKTC